MLNPCCPNCGCMPCVCPPGGVCPCVALISGTAPTNATPGTLWFDGAILWIWTGAAWVVVGPAAGQYQVVSFTTPGTFIFQVPADSTATTTYRFRLQAGGGAGGGYHSPDTWGGMGGGGGEYKEIAWIGPAPGLDISCYVGNGGLGGLPGSDGNPGEPTQVSVQSTNTTIIAANGAGGWGSGATNNNSGEGLGGNNGTFNPGTQNILLVASIGGGDAHLGTSPSDTAIGGADSFMGMGQPSFDPTTGWNDTMRARGYGAGGRGAWQPGSGGEGTPGIVIIERIKG